jgi:site-specific DNA recombinase
MPSTNGHDSRPERVALYLRVSSEEQKKKESIATQDAFLEEYCKLYGLEVAGIYRDEAVSGTVPMRERPEGVRLLADAKAGFLDAVLVYKLDRIGRSLLVVVDAHDRLGEANVALRSATEPIDTSTPAGRLIFQMLASFAEFERATITERSRDGLQRAFEEGKQLGCIPYGYDIAEDGAFVVVEDEAQVVRQIIANVAAGGTLYSEAKRLNDEGAPSPGRKYRGRPRKHGPSWAHTTVRGIVRQEAYAGTHVVHAHKGPVERKVPAIVEPELRDKALARLEENKRYAGGKPGRKYLLRGLVWCSHCGTAYTGGYSRPSWTDKRYYKYHCRKRRTAGYDKRVRGNSCPNVKAQWLEELVWRDVRSFLENPGEVLERVREQLDEDREGDDLEARHGSLRKRLATKQEEKSRYVKLYAQGYVNEEELEVYLTDLRNQVENLRLLLASVEADLAAKHENKMVARTTEAWLMALRKNLVEVERDTEEAFENRRELAKLLVEKITVGRDEEGRVKVDITYRFGPPEVSPGEHSVNGVQNSEEFSKAHGRGGGSDLLSGHPKMSSYEVAVERGAGAPDPA